MDLEKYNSTDSVSLEYLVDAAMRLDKIKEEALYIKEQIFSQIYVEGETLCQNTIEDLTDLIKDHSYDQGLGRAELIRWFVRLPKQGFWTMTEILKEGFFLQENTLKFLRYYLRGFIKVKDINLIKLPQLRQLFFLLDLFKMNPEVEIVVEYSEFEKLGSPPLGSYITVFINIKSDFYE